ncbi:FkbM family methyltransferase [Nostoc sp. FACHB-133]|uniref:FkbM family methyltransferase n=1 Tax=Nostoc sp. FACHB-133 TaxID=2692835 RepID=UPI0016873352|nr:FkbM family methyltransferase [Nostoc sp. FACHB-133]MBD2522594.1 FkbM family methyltransferase [Nostoc sp. FACHB-133]
MVSVIKENIQLLANKVLKPFNLRLARLAQGVGMDLCLKGLAQRGYSPQVVLDIGAAQGSWTKLAMQSWPDAGYFMIEPLEERLPPLKVLTNQHSNTKFILAAAGSEPGTLQIGVTQDLDSSSLMYSGIGSREVPIVSIDNLFEQGVIKQPHFIKIDVQGYELNVLSGAKKVLKSSEFILLELQFFRFSSEMILLHESIAWMNEQNFQPYEIVNVLRRPLDNAMGQCDILFIRKDHWLLKSQNWS